MPMKSKLTQGDRDMYQLFRDVPRAPADYKGDPEDGPWCQHCRRYGHGITCPVMLQHCDSEPSKRRLKKLHAEALREDRRMSLAELEYLDDQLLGFARG